MAKATNTLTTNRPPRPNVGLLLDPANGSGNGRCYTLQLDDNQVLVDPTNKGKPGDVVVLWPKRKAPVVTRKLARIEPCAGDADRPAPMADRYYFADLETGALFDIALNKVAAIHKVLGDL